MSPEPTPAAAAPAALDERLPPLTNLALALQHLLVSYASLVLIPLILAGALGLDAAALTILVSSALFTSGLCTLLQCVGVGQALGIRLPVVQGTTIAAVPALLMIGAGYGLNALFGATIVAGAGALVLAGLWGRLLVLFPPVVTGTVITAIGITLLPVAVMWMSGAAAPGAAEVGFIDFSLGLFTLALVLLIMRFGRALVARAAILVGLVVGTLLGGFLGVVDLAPVASAPWFSLVVPFAFGAPEFVPAACVAMLIVMLVTMVESTGDYLAIGEVCRKSLGPKDIAAGIRAEGLGTMLGGIFNSFPFTTFSQNTGVLRVSGVRSRWVVATAGGIMLLLSLLPKLGALVSVIPTPVLGGCGIVMFGSIAVAGINMLRRVDLEADGNLVVVSVSLGLAMLVIANPLFFAGFGESVQLALGNAITLAALAAVTLNLVFNGIARQVEA